MICIANLDGYFKKINPAFQNNLGFSEEELLSKPFIEFVHPDHVSSTIKEIEKLATGQTTISFENKFIKKDGSFIDISWVANPSISTGDLFAIGRNISEEILRKNEINELINFQNVILNGTDYSIIATNPDGIITLYNKGAQKLLGYSKEEIINKVTPGILHDANEVITRAKILSQELKVNVEPGFDVFVVKSRLGIADVNEWTYIKKNGERIAVELAVTTLRNLKNEITGYLGIANDVTEKKKSIQLIKEGEQRFLKVFEENPIAMSITNIETSRFDYANKAFLELAGFKKEEVIGKTSLEINITSLEIRDEVSSMFSNAGYLKNYESYIVTKKGDKIWIILSLEFVEINNKKFILSTMHNIQQRKIIEEEIKQAKLLAEESLKAKDAFLTNMSHEIRTPMNAIVGFGNLLKDTKLDNEQKDFISTINIAAENLLGVINDILDFSKIESGKIVLEDVPFSILEMLNNLKKINNHKAIEKQIILEFNTDPTLPNYISGDPTRINQILINLINNAIRFTNSGKVSINSRKINENNEIITICFDIIDTGIGISEEKLPIIFERFTQANSDTTRNYGGTGLGLSISKALVEMLGGNLNVISKLSEGSTFSVTLPLKKINREVIEKVEKIFYPSSPKNEIKILLVEDNLLNQKLAIRVLNDFGFKIELAENGLIAIGMLKNGNYDIVIMDLQMPVMDGYEATKIIRQEFKSSIPIVAMTAHSIVGEMEKCINIGMNDYISKPFSPHELYNKILLHAQKLQTNNQINSDTTFQKSKNVVNLNYLRELSGGSLTFEKEMIELFVNHVPEDLELLNISIIKSDFNSIKAIAHKLKSSFSLIGVEGSDELSEIENNADSKKNIETISSLFGLIKTNVNEALIELKKEPKN